MAGPIQTEKKYVLTRDREKAGTSQVQESLADLNREEVEAAVQVYGIKAIIEEYRLLGAAPPAYILLAYFYQDPSGLTDQEREGLQEVYGSEVLNEGEGREDAGEKRVSDRLKAEEDRILSALESMESLEEEEEGQILPESPHMEAADMAEDYALENAAEEDRENRDQEVTRAKELAGEDGDAEEGLSDKILNLLNTQGGETKIGGVRLWARNLQYTGDVNTFQAEEAGMEAENVFGISLSNVLFSRDKMAFQGESAVNVKVSEENRFSVAASNVGYDFTASSPFWDRMDGEGAISFSGIRGMAGFSGAVYKDEGLSSQQAEVSVEVEGKRAKAEGGGLVFTKEGSLEFEELKGEFSGDITLMGGSFSISSPKAAIEKEEEPKDSINPYTVSVEADQVKIQAGNSFLSALQPSVCLEGGIIEKIELKDGSFQLGGFVKGEAGQLTYEGEEKKLNAQDISLNLEISGQSAFLNAGSLSYEKELFSIKEVKGSVKLSFGGLEVEAVIEGGSYEDGMFQAESISGTGTLQGQSLTVTGTGLSYSQEKGLDYETFTGKTESLKFGDFLELTGASLEMAKEGDSHQITVQGGMKAEAAGSSIGAAASKFLFNDQGIESGEAENAYADIYNGFLKGSMGKAVYDGQEDQFRGENISLSTDIAGNTASIFAESLFYSAVKTSIQGINGGLHLSAGPVGLDANLTGGNYEEGKIQAESFSGTGSFQGQSITAEGTGLSCSQEEGLDYETFTGKSDSLKLGSFLELTGASLEIVKDGASHEITVQGGVKAAAAGSVISAASSKFLFNDQGIERGEAENAAADIYNGFLKGSIGKAVYDGQEDKFTGETISLSADIAGNTASITAESLRYSQEETTIQGISGALNLRVGPLGIEGNLSGGSYENGSIQAENLTGTGSFQGQTITAEGTGLSYSQEEGLDYETFTGKSDSLKLGSFLELTGASLEIVKDGESHEITVQGGVKAEAAGSSIGASSSNFLFNDQGIESGEVENAAADIYNGFLKGTIGKAIYDGQKDKFTGENISLSADIAGNTASIRAESLRYSQEETTIQGISGALNLSVGPLGVTGNLTEGSYENGQIQAESLTGTGSFQGQTITAEGTGLSYSQEEGLNYETFTGKSESLKFGSFLELTNASLEIIKDGTSHQITVQGGAKAAAAGSSIEAAASKFLFNDQGIESGEAENASADIYNGFLKGSIGKAVYDGQEDQFTGENISLSADIAGNTASIRAESLRYSQEETSLQGISGALNLSVGPLGITGNLTGGSYENGSIQAESLTGTGSFQGQAITAEGTGLSYSQEEGLDYETFTGKSDSLKFGSFLELTGASLEIVKDGESHEITVQGGVKAEAAGSSIGASSSNFLFNDQRIESGEVENAAADIYNGFLKGTIGKAIYDGQEDKFTGETISLSADIAGNTAAITAESLHYSQEETSIQGISGALNLSVGPLGVTGNLTGGSYENGTIQAESLTGTGSFQGQTITAEGSGISYSQEEGLDYETFTGKSESLKFGSFLELTGASLEIVKDRESHEITAQGGVKAEAAGSTIGAAASKFLFNDQGIESGEAENASADIYNGFLKGSIGKAVYDGQEDKFTGETISLSADIAGNTAAITAESLHYSQEETSIQGISGNLDLSIGPFSVAGNLTGGNYENGTIQAESLTGTGSFQSQSITAEGTGISYSQENGLDYETFTGKSESLKFGSFLELTNASLEIVKDGASHEITVQGGVKAEAAGSSIGAAASKFLFNDQGIESGEVENASADIYSGFLKGSIGKASYDGQADQFTGEAVSLSADIAGNTASITAESLRYSQEETTIQGISGALNLSIGPLGVAGNLTGGNYENGKVQAESLTGTGSFQGQSITAEGTGLTYSREEGLNYETFTGKSESLRFGSFLELTGASLEIVKEGTSHQITLQGGVRAEAAGSSIGAGASKFFFNDQGIESGEVENASVNIHNGFLKGSIGKASYDGQADQFTGETVSLSADIAGNTASITAESLRHSQEETSIQGIAASLDLSIGPIGIAGNLSGGRYENGSIQAESLTGTGSFQGQSITAEGTGLTYSQEEGLNYETFTGKSDSLKFGSFLELTNASLEIVKDGESHEITVQGGVKAEAAGSSIGAAASKFFFNDQGIERGEVENAFADIHNGFLKGSIGKVSYDGQSDQFTGETVSLSADIAGNTASVRAESLRYSQEETSIQGISGALNLSVGPLGITGNLTEGSYENGQIQAESLTGTGSFQGQSITAEGTGLSYSQEKGLDYDTFTGKSESLKFGSFLELTNTSLEITKDGTSHQVTVQGGVKAEAAGSTMSAASSNFLFNDQGIESGEIEGAAIDIHGGFLKGGAGKLSYIGQENKLTGEQLELSASVKGNQAGLTAESLQYTQEGITLQGVEGELNVSVSRLELTAGLTGGSYEDGAIQAESIKGTGKLSGQNTAVTAEATGISYSQEAGFDFHSFTGKVEGSLKAGSFLELKNADLAVTKEGTDYETTLSSGIDVNLAGSSLTSERAEFLFGTEGIKNGEIKEAKLSVYNNMMSGRAGDIQYSAEEESFKGTEVSLGLQAAGQSISISASSFAYDKEGFSVKEIGGQISLTLGGRKTALSMEKGEYEKGRISIGKASGQLPIGNAQISLEGENLSYENGTFDFERLKGEADEIRVFSGFSLTKASIEVKKEGQEGAYGVTLSSGLNAEVKNIIKVQADNVTLVLSGEEFGDTDITNASLDIKNGLIHGGSENIHFSPVQKKISVENLQFSSDPSHKKEAADIDQFKDTWGFLNLKNIGVRVKQLSYDEENGLSYSGFSFSPATVKIGTDTTGVIVDFEKKQAEGYFKWSFPSGGTLGEGYEAPRLLYAGVDVMVVPGISLGGGIGVGAGLMLEGRALLGKDGEEAGHYKAEGKMSLQANAWIGADVHISLGAASIAALKAAIEAKAGMSMKAEIGMAAGMLYEDRDLSFTRAAITYDMSAAAELSLSAKISGKLLFFRERTLYQKDLGRWKLGDFRLNGSTEWDGEHLDKDKLKDNVSVGGKAVADGSLNDSEVELEDQGQTRISERDDSASVEELLRLEEERKKAEDMLLEENAIWGEEGGEAAQAVTKQIQCLAEVYDRKLAAMSREIGQMVVNRDREFEKVEMDYAEMKIRGIIASDISEIGSQTLLRVGMGQGGKYADEIKNLQEQYKIQYRMRYLQHIRSEILVIFGDNMIWFSQKGDNKGVAACQKGVNDLKAIDEDSLGIKTDGQKVMERVWNGRKSIKGWEEAERARQTKSKSDIVTRMLSKNLYARARAQEEMKGRVAGRYASSQEGLLTAAEDIMRMAQENARRAQGEYDEKSVPFLRAKESTEKAMAERSRLQSLRRQMEGFLNIPAVQAQARSGEFRDICARIREYRIQENLDEMAKARDDFAAARS